MTDHTDTDWKAWRTADRKRLLALRHGLPLADREALARRIVLHLDSVVRASPPAVLGLYWPIKHEFDLRAWAATLAAEHEVTLALPVVTTPRQPLVYWRWRPGDRMTRGVWNIPVPAAQDPVDPDLVIAPLVGFHGCWRLGYGGGYFDRTLAARTPRPKAIGVGLDVSEVVHFVPQKHDIPLDAVITERRIVYSEHGSGLAPISPSRRKV